MSEEVFLPSYAKIPNGPHEPNITLPGIMVVDQPYKMAKTLMKLAHRMAKPVKSPKAHGKRAQPKTQKKDGVKWY
jgi:hypothetical protein